MKHKILLLFVLFLFLFLNSYSQNGSTAEFLKIGIGSRASAMGEAFAGILNDPSSIYWNPAGLATMESSEMMASYNTWLIDMSYQYLGFVLPIWGKKLGTQGEEIFKVHHGTLGAYVFYTSSGNITKMDENFNDLGTFNTYNLVGAFSYANKLGNDISYGVSLKVIQQKLEDITSTTFGADIGFQYKISFIDGLFAGFAAQNLSMGTKFINETESLPLNFKFGLAYNIGPLMIVGDINKYRDSKLRINTGAEFMLFDIIAFRGGFNTANSYTAGIGFKINNYFIDYAFIPYKDFNVSHRFTARIRF